MQLRRMNSEARAFEGRERTQYLNLGGESPVVEGNEDGFFDEDEKVAERGRHDGLESVGTVGGRRAKDEELGEVGRDMMERARRESDLGVEGVDLGTLGGGAWEWCLPKGNERGEGKGKWT